MHQWTDLLAFWKFRYVCWAAFRRASNWCEQRRYNFYGCTELPPDSWRLYCILWDSGAPYLSRSTGGACSRQRFSLPLSEFGFGIISRCWRCSWWPGDRPPSDCQLCHRTFRFQTTVCPSIHQSKSAQFRSSSQCYALFLGVQRSENKVCNWDICAHMLTAWECKWHVFRAIVACLHIAQQLPSSISRYRRCADYSSYIHRAQKPPTV